MATGGAPRRDGPIALSALFDDALRELASAQVPTQAVGATSDGFLYSANRHESIPRALFLDRRLTPLEHNAWQVFRLQLNDGGVTAFPTYDQLRPYLASMPCAAQASYETVARALTLLRRDALAQPRAPAARPEDGPNTGQPLRPARRAADALRGDAA